MSDVLMKKKALKNTGERFYFDKHIFDEGYVDPKEAEAGPPEPVYSQQELDAARQESFERGRQYGLKESSESRAQQVAHVLGSLAQDIKRLITAETARERIYEQESLRLIAAMLEKLFPALDEKYGFDELKAAVADLLKKRGGKGSLSIEVSPENLEGIQEHLEKLRHGNEDLSYTVKGNEALAPHACRISWDDGGAVRDSQALAAEIGAIIEETLAAGARSRHDSTTKTHPSDAEHAKGDEQ